LPNPFEYHKPEADEVGRIEDVRNAFEKCLTAVLFKTSPGSVSGRYVALCRTALEEACMWATKSIVFERDNVEPPPAKQLVNAAPGRGYL
jgi:hypothetical protein